jgi:hypothetical protein
MLYQKSPVSKALQKPAYAFKRTRRRLVHRLEDYWRLTVPSQNFEGIVNQKEIRIIGLKRTGNHAVINWIKKQEQGIVRHINDIRLNENPYSCKADHLLDCYPEYANEAERLYQEAKGNFRPKDCLIYNYEDFSIEQITAAHVEKKHDIYFGKSGERFDLIILRDPFNLIASRIKKNFIPVKPFNKTVIDLWIEYAKEFLGETQYLNHNKVFVNYNQWATDYAYRQNIADRLKLNFTDAGIDDVHTQAGGSSFDGTKYQGKASEMNTSGRWKYFADDPRFYKLLANEELIAYSERIFGHIPGTEILLKTRNS